MKTYWNQKEKSFSMHEWINRLKHLGLVGLNNIYMHGMKVGYSTCVVYYMYMCTHMYRMPFIYLVLPHRSFFICISYIGLCHIIYSMVAWKKGTGKKGTGKKGTGKKGTRKKWHRKKWHKVHDRKKRHNKFFKLYILLTAKMEKGRQKTKRSP